MRNIDILIGFEREINKLNNSLDKPTTDDSLYWLNQAVSKFVKTRFNGNLPHLTSYEQTEKRSKDLINLLVDKELPIEQDIHGIRPDYVTYHVQYPDDFMFALNEDVMISDLSGDHKIMTSVFECTADSFMYRVTNSLTDFHYRHYKARPLRVRTMVDGSQGCDLLTDGKYKILKYRLGYLRNPNKISLEKPLSEYSEFPEIIMPEIIKTAAQMYIENKSDQRYQTLTNEVNTQE